MKHNWYYRGGSKSWEFFSILHIPYTSMVLAYVTIGTVLAPTFDLGLLGLLLAAYFLGLGIAAHAADQLSRTGTRYVKLLTRTELWAMVAWSLVGALLIGLYAFEQYHLTLWFVPLVALNVFFAFAYPRSDWFGGRFHSDETFAVSWGALPFITAYLANTTTVPWHIVLIAAVLAITAGMEITLSRWVRSIRAADGILLHVTAHYADGTTKPDTIWLSPASHIRKPELALKLLVVEVDLLAVALLLWRLGA